MNAPATVPGGGPGGARNGGRERIFSDYVRAVAPGQEPDPGLFERTWRHLRGALRRELRRRGLWTAPPSFLGVYGYSSWRDPGALDDLTGGCYEFTFVVRLRSLRAQLRTKDNVDGLVFLNVRNFVHGLQRDHDPVGHRAYQVLERAVELAADEGLLSTPGAGRRLGGSSVLSFAAGAGEELTDAPPDGEERAHRQRVLAGLVEGWNTELLPGLVTARGRETEAVAADLARRLPEIAGAGLEAVHVSEVLGPLRRDLRQRWAQLLWQAQGDVAPRESVEAAAPADDEDGDAGFVQVLSLYRPPPSPERRAVERDTFRSLTDCVWRQVEGLEADDRTRGYLERFWQFLRTCVQESEAVPSQRKLSRFLDIPRDRFPELYDRLGAMVRRCREGLAAGAGREAARTGDDPRGNPEKEAS